MGKLLKIVAIIGAAVGGVLAFLKLKKRQEEEPGMGEDQTPEP